MWLRVETGVGAGGTRVAWFEKKKMGAISRNRERWASGVGSLERQFVNEAVGVAGMMAWPFAVSGVGQPAAIRCSRRTVWGSRLLSVVQSERSGAAGCYLSFTVNGGGAAGCYLSFTVNGVGQLAAICRSW
jgi:hypothetical protein